jgi:hypothetical protein
MSSMTDPGRRPSMGRSTCCALPWISFDRGRDCNADASGQTVHPQSRPRQSSRSSSGSGCGVFRARSSPSPCWRSPRSSATVFGLWLHLAIFSRGEAQPLSCRRLNCLDVGKTPAQSRGDDQNDGDRTEISGLLSSRQMLPHFSDHLELALKRFGIISSSLYSYGCSPSEQNWSLH